MEKRKSFLARAAMMLLLTVFTTMTVWAQTTSTINVGGTDYTLFTGFTATDGNGNNWANLVDGNTSTDWIAMKSSHFNGGTDDPAFVEFHADAPIIPKGYVLTCDDEDAGFWKPVQWALKARLNEGDAWTTIHSSNTTLGDGKTFEIPCSNDGNNKYKYFRFEVYEVGSTTIVNLDELQFYGLLPAYTHLTVKAATCTATGIKVDCYRRNSDGKYFTDETCATELAESDVIAPMIPHTGEHHEATDVNIEYWQCSMCGKYFCDEGYTTEITEEQTKIYRTITIDGSISSLVTCDVSQELAGETVYLYISDLIDDSTLKVNDGAVEVAHDSGNWYFFTMPAADVTVTAEVVQSNVDGDILTGSIRHTVTIADGANITLNNATISGSIVCKGSATITLVGTNSVSGASNTAGIQIGGSGTTLTIRGDGSLTANGGDQSAGIGLSCAWDPDDNVIGGDIIIEGGNITANGGSQWGAGIGTGVIYGNGSAKTARIGNITIKGGSVKATGGSEADGIGTGYTYYGCTNTIGTVTIYDGIDKVDASSIKNSGSIVYKHGETDVTDSKTDYFNIIEDGDRRIIVNIDHLSDGTAYTLTSDKDVTTATYTKSIGDERVGKYQAWFVPFDYTVTTDDLEKFDFFKINFIANAAEEGVNPEDDHVYIFLNPIAAGTTLYGNKPYVYRAKEAVDNYSFTTENTTLLAKNESSVLQTSTTLANYDFYGTYDNVTATPSSPFYYISINGNVCYGTSVTVGPYRWILRATSKGGVSYAPQITFSEGETTAIDHSTFNVQRSTFNVYDLQGRKVANGQLKKGLYIVNGRKVVIK